MNCVRDAVAAVWADHINSRPWEERQSLRFELLIAVTIPGRAPQLFAMRGTAPVRVPTYECLGCGRQLARHIVAAGYHRTMRIEQAALLAVHTIAAAKRIVDGVDGKPELAWIVGDRLVLPLWDLDVGEMEGDVNEYERRSETLLLGIGNAHLTEAEFEQQLKSFLQYVRKTRRSLKRPHSSFREFLGYFTQPRNDESGPTPGDRRATTDAPGTLPPLNPL
jgi:hypothetical protein